MSLHLHPGRRTSICLLRVLRAERLASIDRFSEELLAALGEDPELIASAFVPPRPGPKSTGSLQRQFGRFVTYPRAARRLSADVFHIVDQSYAQLLRALPQARTVVTCHDLAPLRVADDHLPVALSRRALARYRFSVGPLVQAGSVICVSETTRADVVRFLDVPPERLRVIPPGLSGRFRPLPAEEIARLRSELIGFADVLLLHVDSGLPYKNRIGTIRIVHELERMGLIAQLVRAGPELDAGTRVLTDELGVTERVTDLGKVSDTRLVELYNAADVFLFPSHHEGFGWPPLEAMASGTPVVTSDCGALQELVGTAGLTAPATDAAALAGRVFEIASSPELAADLRRQGLSRAAGFSWQRTAGAYSAEYKRLAAAGS